MPEEEQLVEVGHQFSSPQLKIVYQLIDQGVISGVVQTSGQRDVSLDLDKAKGVLEQNIRDEKVLSQTRTKEELEIAAKKAFPVVVKNFLDSEVLSLEMLQDMQRIVDVDHIVTVNELFCRFLYTGRKFPSEGEPKGRIEISPEWFKFVEEGYRRGLEIMGVELNPDQFLEYAMRRFVGHELGHAIEKSKVLGNLAKTQGDDYFKEIERFERNIYDNAPNQSLAYFLEGVPDDFIYTRKFFTTSERIAVGYEFVAVEGALTALGVSPEKVEESVGLLFLGREKRLDDWRVTVDAARGKGLDVILVGMAVDRLNKELKEQGRDDLRSFLPSRGFGASDMGYDAPLRLDEIKKHLVGQ